jgi:hypothetical protein
VTTSIKLVKPVLVTTSIKLVKPALVTTSIKLQSNLWEAPMGGSVLSFLKAE